MILDLLWFAGGAATSIIVAASGYGLSRLRWRREVQSGRTCQQCHHAVALHDNYCLCGCNHHVGHA